MIGRQSRLKLAFAVVVLAVGVTSTAAATRQRVGGSFCGTVYGAATWVAKVRAPDGSVVTASGENYWFWGKHVDCTWAEQKTAFLTHALGTAYMKFADLGDFTCTAIRPPKRGHVLSLRPLGARGKCWNTSPNSVARFEWRPVGLPPRWGG